MNEPSLYKTFLNTKYFGINEIVKARTKSIKLARKEFIKDPHCIDCSDLCEKCTLDIQKDFDVRVMPHYRLPFLHCWLETGAFGNLCQTGILMISSPHVGTHHYQYEDKIIVISAILFVNARGIPEAIGYVQKAINSNNKIVPIYPKTYPEILLDYHHPDPANQDDLQFSQCVNGFTYQASHLCLSWLNAKNIKLQANDFNPKYQKHARKHLGINNIKYYTLNVVKPGKQYESSSSGDEHQGIMPLHLCRGHLKHFTEEKPLFGKYPGTFFIPAHVRGHKENGTIKKNYKLKTGITI